MPFAKGKSGNPAGRARGSKNNSTRLKEAALAKVLAKYKTPLDFLLGVMTSDKFAVSTRIDAAKVAAPYVHKRMPIAIENSDKGPFQLMDVAKLKGMEEGDLLQLRALIAKAVPEDAQ